MKPWWARLHRWLGLVVGLQVILWLASGLTMSLLDPAAVEGKATRAAAPATPPWPQAARAPGDILAAHGAPAERIESAWLLGRPVWRVVSGDASVLHDAYTGARVEIDARAAREIARRDYRGAARAGTPQRLATAPLEARGHPGPLWRVLFADEAHTTLYISAQDGRVLERRTDAFRLFDIAWMLHIMDYTGRADFNHPLVVTMAGGGTLLALSGLWLLGLSITHGAFRPQASRRRIHLRVRAGADASAIDVPARAGEPVLQALHRAGLLLPSRCGGGQTCGQCTVRVEGRAPPAGAGDRARLPSTRLQDGERLACALPARDGLAIEVPRREALEQHTARVVRIDPVSPTLRHIVLAPEGRMPPFAAGQFIEIDVPPFGVPAASLSDARAPLPDAWLASAPATIGHALTVARAYSPSLSPALGDGMLPLLVRLEADPAGNWFGPGSAYLFSRREGDLLRFRGPFGDFRLTAGEREKVFIGGGAGLAPLRAMLRDRLHAGGRERLRLWVGARTPDEVPFAGELAALDAAHPNFDVRVVYSEWDGDDAGRRWLHEAVEEALSGDRALADCEFYVCGPPAMLTAVLGVLARAGVDPDRVAYEDFG